MKIEINSLESVYITINGIVFYIDYSTIEPYINFWPEPIE